MTSHYTFVDSIGNRVFHRYWNGKEPKIETLDSFPIELFIRGRQKDSTSIHGETLSKIEFSKIRDACDFIKEHSDVAEIYGQTSFAHQFIANRYPGEISFSINNFCIVGIDIETKFDETGFPHPAKAAQEIASISCKVFGRPGFISFGTKEFKTLAPEDEYIRSGSESEMLVKFIGWWNRLKPDIVTGWNIVGFDIPYLVNRLIKVLGQDQAIKLSPFHPYTKNVFSEHAIQGDQTSFRILGITVFDYLELYRKFSRGAQESYKLDFIANVELGEAKIDWGNEYKNLMDLYERNHQLYIEYNIHDVRLVESLDNKLKFLFLGITLGFIGKVRLHEIFSQVKFWDNIVYNELLAQNIQIPPQPDSVDAKGIEGAFVKDPNPGLYRWIASLDLTSLYPSIIMGMNMSPETIRVNGLNERILERLIDMTYPTEDVHANNNTLAANGSQYTREFVGIMPAITKKMFASRKAFKNRMLSVEREIEALKLKGELSSEDKDLLHRKKDEQAQYDAMQNAFKIALNSLYGAQGNQHFRYFDPNIAEGITMTGQCIIRYISNQMNDYMNQKLKTDGVDYVVANDTDSAYLRFDTLVDKVVPAEATVDKRVDFVDKFICTYIEPFIAQKFQELADYLNLIENTLSMKREAIADKAIWRGKKNYILQVYDNEGVRFAKPKLKMMGIETARSSTPKICKVALTKGYDIMLNGTEQELIEHVKQFKADFMKAPLAHIAFPRGVTDMDKWMDKNTIWKIGTPIHVKAALMYNIWLNKYKLTSEYPTVKNGDKIKFVYLKEPNPTLCNTIAFVDDLHEEFGLDEYVDRDLQYEKTFLGPLRSFSNLVGYNTEKKAVLDAFFSDDDVVTTVAVAPSAPAPAKLAEPKKPKPEHIPSPKDDFVRPKPVAKPRKKDKVTIDSFFD